jgi:predicted transcriptional regulator
MNQEDDEATDEEIRKAVVQSIKYLMEEGLIVEENKRYRIKTQEEVNKEINDILND